MSFLELLGSMMEAFFNKPTKEEISDDGDGSLTIENNDKQDSRTTEHRNKSEEENI